MEEWSDGVSDAPMTTEIDNRELASSQWQVE